MLEDKDFELLEETPTTEDVVVNDPDITDDDFTLTQVDESVHEQKFQTKPTTFLKDSLKRFRKNKSSVVAAYILGGLLLMSIFIPIIDRSDIKNPHPEETYLAPKLFNKGTGFWDGTISKKNIALDISEMPDAQTEEEKQEHWWPSSEHFPQRSAISKKKISKMKYVNAIPSTDSKGTFGIGGYVQFGYYEKNDAGYVEFSSNTFNTLNLSDDLYLTVFDVYNLEKIAAREGKEFGEPANYDLGQCAFYFDYVERDASNKPIDKSIMLVDYAPVHNIGSEVASYAEEKKNISDIIKNETGATEFESARFAVRMLTDSNDNICTLIGGIAFETNSADEKVKQAFEDMSFTDATRCLSRKSNSGFQYWSSDGIRYMYLSKAYFCSFVYDTYDAAFGLRVNNNFAISDLLNYQDKGWITFKNKYIDETTGEEVEADTLFDTEDSNMGYCLDTNPEHFKCTILDSVHCPLAKPVTLDDINYGTAESDGLAFGYFPVRVTLWQYKVLGYESMPRYLMGTDKSGRDMLKYAFEGLRTSLLLGVLTFAVCFTFGLIWGSISGYFGGTVDIVMERFMEILGGVPWVVMMTLIIIHLGSNFWTFALALCMTGWMGTAARTRTQFYRFRGREYVLASRTLGASDARLIVKHILPNAMGTIITGAVLMIPSVIFSEATISYLGLGLKNMSSLGVILSDNQAELLTSPYLLIFPAIVIALIMISFNLFGNGLRDAINPSLKGED